MHKSIYLAMAAGLFATASHAAAAGPVKTSFVLVGQTFKVTLPEGFCLPEGPLKAQSEHAAAIDTNSVTDLTFYDCEALKPGGIVRRYGTIKTPKSSLSNKIPPRSELLARLQAGIADGSLKKSMNEGALLDKANEDVRKATGDDVKLTGLPGFVSTDQNAAYTAGITSGQIDGQRSSTGTVGGLTVIRGRMIGWALYVQNPSEADMKAMYHDIKPIVAHFITENGG